MAKADERLRNTPAAYIVFFILAVALIIRGFYGFCQSDESFYVSTAGRFASGDLIFVDEWHPTQLAFLITMPFYKLYNAITGGTEGIILYFRILYVLLTFFEAVISFRIVSNIAGERHCAAARRKYSAIPGFILGLFLMLYCHLNIPSLSYYTMSFNFFVLAFILAYAGIPDAFNPVDDAIKSDEIRENGAKNDTLDVRSPVDRAAFFLAAAGASFALSVLSLPSLVIPAFVVFFILILLCIKVKAARFPTLFFVAGVMIPFMIFIIYLYASGNSIAGLLANLSYIISDGEHDRGYVESAKVFFRAISEVFGRIYYLSIVMVIVALLSYVNSGLKRMIRPYILITDLLLFIYYAVLVQGHTGFINTAFALFVFPLFFLTEKKDWYIFLSLFMGGLVFAMTYSLSSYCDLYGLSIGHGIAAAGSILLIWDYMIESYEGKEKDTIREKAVRYMLSAVILTFILITMVLRITNVYRDDRVSRLTCRIGAGPAAGLMTSPEHEAQYASVLASIVKYTSNSDENPIQGKNDLKVFFSKILPWGYTASGLRVGAPDTWRNPISNERLMEYYKTHDMPDIVFVMNTDVASFENTNDVEADPIPNLNEFEGELAEILRTDYEEYIENDCSVYIKKK